MEDNLTCAEKGIPEYLWRKEREKVVLFDDDELIYRRFKTPLPESFSKENINLSELKSFSGEVFQLRNDSYNRSKYCECPEDVLYNDFGHHKKNHGILSLKTMDVHFEFPLSLNNKVQTVSVKAVHEPLNCNYAHCIIQYAVDNVIPDEPNPGRLIKDAVRRKFYKYMTVYKKPD